MLAKYIIFLRVPTISNYRHFIFCEFLFYIAKKSSMSSCMNSSMDANSSFFYVSTMCYE